MIKDVFGSFTDNLKQKATNPFLGALIIVWIFHNWDLVFTFFNFDKGLTMKEKIEILAPYFKFWTFMGNLGICVGLTILVIGFTYLLINLSQYIVDVFNKRLKPWVLSLNDKNAIVPLEDLDAMKLDLRELREKYDKEVTERIKYQDQYRELKDKEIENSMSGGITTVDTITEGPRIGDTSQDEIAALKIFDRIEKTENAHHFVIQANNFLTNLIKGQTISDHPLINDFLKYRLVEWNEAYEKYKITEIGKAFFYQMDKQKGRFNL